MEMQLSNDRSFFSHNVYRIWRHGESISYLMRSYLISVLPKKTTMWNLLRSDSEICMYDRLRSHLLQARRRLASFCFYKVLEDKVRGRYPKYYLLALLDLALL